jgi:hypothetical protein
MKVARAPVSTFAVAAIDIVTSIVRISSHVGNHGGDETGSSSKSKYG